MPTGVTREAQAAERGLTVDQQIARVPIVRLARAAAREEVQNFSIESEQHVLGALLADGNALPGISGLQAEHFADERHQRIFSAIRDQAEEYGAASVDAVTVGERVARNGNADDAYIAALAQATPSGRNLERYVELVTEHAQRRQFVQLATEIQERAARGDLEVLRRDMRARLDGIESKGAMHPLDLAELARREPERPREIMEGLPCGYASLSAGHGGAGKSTIEFTRAICIAAERSFFGLPVERRRVAFLSCEDRADVLHWRATRICRYLSADLGALDGWLHILDLVGQDALLWRGYDLTPAYDRLATYIKQNRIEVLFVDGVADTFGGDENRRCEVKHFVNALVRLIPADCGAVVLIAHVAKATATGESTREGYSGSTSWNNSVRARWYLYPETLPGEDGEGTRRTGDLVLELQKANLRRADRSIRFRWDDDAHLFVGETVAASTFDRKHQEREQRDGIVAAMRAAAAAGDYIPAAMTGPRTGHHVLAVRSEMPESLRSGKAAKRRFWRRIEELRAMRTVKMKRIPRAGDPGHFVNVLALIEQVGQSGNA